MNQIVKTAVLALLGLWMHSAFAGMSGAERFNSMLIEETLHTGVFEQEQILIPAGANSAEQQLDLTGVGQFHLDIILPIDGASFALYSPDGQLMLDSFSTDLQIETGSSIQEGLPGARYGLPALTNQYSGRWTIKYSFPTLTEERPIFAMVRGQSPYGMALALSGNKFSTNELVPLAVLALKNGLPYADTSVQLTITQPDGSKQQVEAFDNGQGADLIANDGIYTAHELFQPSQPGHIGIEARVSFTEQGQQILRSQYLRFESQLATITIDNIEVIDSSPTGQCLPEVIVRLWVTSTEEADYVFTTNVDLFRYNFEPNFIPARKRARLPVGQHVIDISFDHQELITDFGHNTELSFAPVSVRQVGEPGDGRGIIIASPLVPVTHITTLNEANICRDMIEITQSVTVVENWAADGTYIESLTLTVPAYVQIPGAYQANVNINPKGSNQILAFLPTIQHLQVGDNQLSFTVPGEKLSRSDGPYELGGLIFYGQGESKLVSVLGVTEAYDKELFIPKRQQVREGSMIGLQRVNWQGVQNQSLPIKVGGYHRFNPAVGWDYELVAKFDLLGIRPEDIIDAYFEVTTTENTLADHQNVVSLHEITEQWQAATVNYEYFCESIGNCRQWPAPIISLSLAKQDNQHIIKTPDILNLVKKWATDADQNNGIALTANPHERSQHVAVNSLKLILITK